MKKYIRTANGRFYRVNSEGKKTRIGREVYLKAIKRENKKWKGRKEGSRKGSRKRSRKRSRKSGKRTSICQQRLQKKIRENMKEFEEGKFASRSQALAVAYSQVAKKYPGCRKYYQR